MPLSWVLNGHQGDQKIVAQLSDMSPRRHSKSIKRQKKIKGGNLHAHTPTKSTLYIFYHYTKFCNIAQFAREGIQKSTDDIQNLCWHGTICMYKRFKCREELAQNDEYTHSHKC
jgi:hypothetical protein